MMLIKTITLDVSNNILTSPVSVQKLSVGDRIDIYLRSRGMGIKLSGDMHARILAKKPDGTLLFNDCTHDGDKISYIITNQTISSPGIVECQLRITGDNEDIYLPKYRALYLDTQLKENQSIPVIKNREFKSLIRNMKTIEDNDFEIPEKMGNILRE